MSYDIRLKGTLEFETKQALAKAIAAWKQAIDDEDECDSAVTRRDLKVTNTTITIDLDASCPATMWEETIGFLEILAENALAGTIKGYFDGELSDTVKARGKTKSKKLEALLEAGTDPSAPDPSDTSRTTPLMMAAYHGKPAIIARLIAAGANLDMQDHAGTTALAWAAVNQSQRGRQKCLELLVEAGANPNLRDFENRTALQQARAWRRQGAEELAALLDARKKRR
jgi:hypothetical protein